MTYKKNYQIERRFSYIERQKNPNAKLRHSTDQNGPDPFTTMGSDESDDSGVIPHIQFIQYREIPSNKINALNFTEHVSIIRTVRGTTFRNFPNVHRF